MISSIQKKLEAAIKGEVRFDDVVRKIYSVDASIYEVEPFGVILPKSQLDLVNAVKIASEEGVSIIPRGGATGLTGGCLGKGLIIDTTKYLNKITEINYDEGFAVCEPGVLQDDLNQSISERGFCLGANTSTGNRATIGGMLANNAAGSHSLLYGQMSDHVIEVEMILAGGEIVTLHDCTLQEWEEIAKQNSPKGSLYRSLLNIKNRYQEDIQEHFPKFPRRASGYNLNSLIDPKKLKICHLLAASEGSFGVFSKITVKLSRPPKHRKLCLLHYHDLLIATDQVREILKLDPIAIELIDHHIIEAGRNSPTMKKRLGWLQGTPQCVLAVEFGGENTKEVEQKSCALIENSFFSFHVSKIEKKSDENDLWAVRKAGLELLLSKRSYQRAIAFIEDIALPPDELSSFLREFQALLKRYGLSSGIYGHVGESCLHIRPYIDLRSEENVMEDVMKATAELIAHYQGVMSGEHGDGLVRSWLNKTLFHPRIYEAFCALKKVFDPDNIMNPHKVVHPRPFLEHLRTDSNTNLSSFKTFQDFTGEGGFELAADLCNGNGLCRKKEGVMCPSFQATGDEYDSTRARAQVLRSIIHGRLSPQSLAHRGLVDVLDLCLECKGCKKECPSQVDVAKMKTEILYHYQEEHGIPFRSRLFGYVPAFTRLGSLFPSLVNRLNQSTQAKSIFTRIGITPNRSLPSITSKRFSSCFYRLPQPPNVGKRVVLFNDTFTEFHHPEIGMSAVKILHRLGYHVTLLPWKCCGRPYLSKGMLKQAQKKADSLIDHLFPFAYENVPIIGLEPSCILTIADDYESLTKTRKEKAKLVASKCQTIDEFLADKINDLPLQPYPKPLLFHGHCHQKAITGTKSSMELLHAISPSIREIPSGCCGMAGSFGYEVEHFDLSMQIGELKLFPEIRKHNDADIVANGISCRQQIVDGVKREAKHIVEVIASVLD